MSVTVSILLNCAVEPNSWLVVRLHGCRVISECLHVDYLWILEIYYSVCTLYVMTVCV